MNVTFYAVPNDKSIPVMWFWDLLLHNIANIPLKLLQICKPKCKDKVTERASKQQMSMFLTGQVRLQT